MTRKRLVTHNGSFHADDLFAAAVLGLYMDSKGYEYEIVRTRDMEVIKNADYVFDVGGIYDPNTNRFDHHQKGRAGQRENGIYFSSFGLVWKNFGLELCEQDNKIFELINKKIVLPIDAVDNGQDIYKPIYSGIYPYTAEVLFLSYSPTWTEDQNLTDQIFKEQVSKIKEILKREIKVAKDDVLGINILEQAYKNSENKKIILLEQSLPRYLYQQVLSSYKDPIYLVYKSGHGDSWKVEAIGKGNGSLESRKPFPKSWCGLMNKDPKAEKIIGLPGIIFTHDSGFLANLDTKENAIKFAEKALNYKEPFSFAKFFKM
jgi:uncharacterized UPF0160 family protein